MVAITVRNLSEDTHRALRARAAAHGRSTEAEIRHILDAVARPEGRLKIGTALVAAFAAAGGVELEIIRDQTPVQPIAFE